MNYHFLKIELILLKILSKQQKEQQAYAAAQQQQAYGATQQHQAMPLYMAPAQVQMSYAPSGGAGGYGADSSGYGGYGGGAGAVGAY